MSSSLRTIATAGQWALLTGLLLLTGILALRRMAGELAAPLTTSGMAATGIALAAAGLSSRLIWIKVLAASGSPWQELASRLVPLGAAILALSALVLPTSSLAGACLLVGLLAAEESWSVAALPWRVVLLGRFFGKQGHDILEASPEASFVAGVVPAHRSHISTAGPTKELSLDDANDQQITRQSCNGEDRLAGHVRVRFAAGQRTAEAHVAFCPPFDRAPHVEFEAVSTPAARIELGQVLPMGARWDVKLAQPAKQPTAILLRFTATLAAKAAVTKTASRCA
jgi:hypothetical protein